MGMKDNKSGKIAAIYIIYILLAGFISILCGIKYTAMIGLLLGSAAAFANYLLLKLVICRLLGTRNIFAVQIFLFRYLLYIAAAYISMRTGSVAVIMYAAGIIGLSLSILIVYGIGGVKNQ